MLDKEEYKRYNRHLILDRVGVVGQEKLKVARVLVIGAGGLGCPVLQYLTAAGVGTIGIIDFDTVDISNLQRQILFTTADIGENKAVAAVKRLKQLNSHVNFEVHAKRLTNKNALDLFNAYDIIVDGSDNFSTRYLVNDAAVLTEKPLVYGAIYTFQGQVAVFNYNGGPSYRCLFPTPPKSGTIKNCSEIGVIGVLPGIIGTQQANETIKLILGIGTPLSGKLLIYDALEANYSQVAVPKEVSEVEKVLSMRVDFELYDYDLFCGVANEKEAHEMDVKTFKDSIGSANIRIIDLREEWEEPALIGANVERITLSEFSNAIARFQTDKQIVLVCQTGTRSQNVRHILEEQYQIKEIKELKGGMQHYDS